MRRGGALGRFLMACEKRLVPRGSALVVESLDRLSRQSPRRTVTLLNQLLDDYQIEVHLTMADKVFRPSEDNGIDLIMAVAMAMRANEESETKSRRLCAAWEKLRERAHKEKRVMVSRVPWWLIVKDGKIVVLKEEGAAVQRIFQLAAEGYGSNQISRKLNEEKVLDPKKWISARIRSLIRSEAPLGTHQESERTRKTGKTYKLVGYYPRVVSDALAAKARAVVQRHTSSTRGRSTTTDRPVNLFRGLLRYRDKWMRQGVRKNDEPNPETGINGYRSSYECLDDSTGKILFSISARQLEPVIVHGLLELKQEDFLPLKLEQKTSRLESLRGKVALLESQAANLLKAIESGSLLVATRLKELGGEIILSKSELSRTEAEEQAAKVPANLDLKQTQVGFNG